MKNYDKKTIIENIKQYRKVNNLTQEDLADKLSYSVKAIASWEQGIVVPPLEALINFSSELNIPLEKFLGIKEESIFDYISDETLKAYNYNPTSQNIFWPNTQYEKTFTVSKLDEGEFVNICNEISRFEPINPNLITKEKEKLIVNLEFAEETSYVNKIFYNHLKKNIIFKLLSKENLIITTDNKIVLDSKISIYILRAMVDASQFGCTKTFWDFCKTTEEHDELLEIGLTPEVMEELEKIEKQHEDELNAIEKTNKDFLNSLLKNKKD